MNETKSIRELALAACDNAFQENMRRIAAVLLDRLAETETDREKAAAKGAFRKAARLAGDVLNTSRAVIDDLWPEVKPIEDEKPVGSGMPSVGVPSA
jgi:hypothetical protein